MVYLMILLAVFTTVASAGDANLRDETIRRVRRKYPTVTQWSAAEAARRLARPPESAPLLLDVRTREEFSVSHLPGASHVAPEAPAETVLAGVPINRTILLYCSVGYRSSALAERLRRAGHPAVANLEGGIFQWASEGRPLMNETGSAFLVHGYSTAWALLLPPERRFLPAWAEADR